MEHSNRYESFVRKSMSMKNLKTPKIDADLPNYLDFDLPIEKYHANRDAVSSSGLKKILTSPDHFKWWLMTGEEDQEDKDDDALRFGRAAHCMILEPKKFRDLYVVEPIHEGFTKDGKPTTNPNALEVKNAKEKWRDKQDPCAEFLSEKEMEDLLNMVDSLVYHNVANGLLAKGRPEVSGFFKDPETGIYCRIRPDYLSEDSDGLVLIDLKTSRNMPTGEFRKVIHRMKYNMQMAFYYDGLTILNNGKPPQMAAFLVLDKAAPYHCNVHLMDDEMLEHGRAQYKHALRLLKRCIETKQWPGRQTQAQMVSLPDYAKFDLLPEFEFD